MKIRKYYVLLAIILFITFLFRFPSLHEPFWYGDEGIFAAVATNLNQGGVLYQTSWDNKPPMIYLTYAAIFKTMGISMFSLRLVTMIVVLATAPAVYEIVQAALGIKRALLAAFIFGFLTSLRLLEGNLALTEIFMILPITLAMLAVIKRRFDYLSLFVAGILFAVASLYKQVGAFEAAALGIFLFFSEKKFKDFFTKGLILSCGFSIPYLATFGYFASKNLVGDYIFAAYTYYRIYLEESPKYAILINIAKILPVVTVIGYGIFKKFKKEKIDVIHLWLLWTAFSFLGSYFSGRTYGHYLIQATPVVSILLSSFTFRPKMDLRRIIFAPFFFIPIFYLTGFLFANFLSAGPINQVKYWQNFVAFALGKKSLGQYNDYFDGNVNTIMALSDSLSFRNAYGENVYIWGDYPWLYAISDLKNPTRYVTSFHVFGVPQGQEEVSAALGKTPPKYIIKPESSIGYFSELEKMLASQYTLIFSVENAKVFARSD